MLLNDELYLKCSHLYMHGGPILIEAVFVVGSNGPEFWQEISCDSALIFPMNTNCNFYMSRNKHTRNNMSRNKHTRNNMSRNKHTLRGWFETQPILRRFDDVIANPLSSKKRNHPGTEYLLTGSKCTSLLVSFQGEICSHLDSGKNTRPLLVYQSELFLAYYDISRLAPACLAEYNVSGAVVVFGRVRCILASL